MASGTISLGTSNQIMGQIVWSSSSNGTAANTSNVTATIQVKRTDSYTTWGTWSGSLTVAGTTESISFWAEVSNSWVTLKTLTVKSIAHKDNGSGTCYIAGVINGPGGTSQAYSKVSSSSTVTLDTIARHGTISSAPNFNDTANPTITYSNPAGTSVDTLEACISLTGEHAEIAYRPIEKKGTSYKFELTEEERNILRSNTKDSTYRKVRFYIRSVIGSSDKRTYIERNVTIVDANPAINPTIIDTNEITTNLTGDPNVLVRYYSNAEITIGASGKKYATIKSNSVTNGSKTLTSNGTINGITSSKFSFTAKDSRGYTTTLPVDKASEGKFIDYVKLTCSIGNGKPNAEGEFTFKVSGNYFNGSFGAIDNALNVCYRYKVYGSDTYLTDDWLPMTVTPGNGTYTASVKLTGLDYQTTYAFEAYAADVLSSVYTDPKNVKATPVFDWGPDDFNINGQLTVSGDIHQQGRPVLTSQTGFTFSGGTEIPSNADLNSDTYEVLGNYYCKANTIAETLTNCPTSGRAFTMKVFHSTGTGYPSQQIIEYSTGKIYYRCYSDYDVKWSSWINIAGPNLNADTVDGQHFHWDGKGGTPTYVWGLTANGNSYPYYPSNFSVNYANTAGSANNIGYAKISGIVLSSGYASVTCSGVKTSSIIVGSRVAASGDTVGSYASLAAVRCETDGTVKIYSTDKTNATWTVNLIWTK